MDSYAMSEPVDMRRGKMGGTPCVAGTRIPVAGILHLLAAGWSVGKIHVDAYPSLTEYQIQMAVKWAACRIAKIKAKR